MASQKISELNERWSLLFRFNMVLIPLVIAGLLAWGVWVTQSIDNFHSFQRVVMANQFTSEDGLRQSERITVEELRINLLEKSVSIHLADIKELLKEIDSKLDNHLIGHQ